MIDSDDDNDSQIVPISEEERLINETKPLAFNAIKIWIENVTSKCFTCPNDFRSSLADGILLCNLLNCLKPGSIKRINRISTAISGYETSPAIDNIAKFLRCCEDDFGLSSFILFELSDLEDLTEKYPDNPFESEKRLERVLLCLFHLAKSVENQLTNVELDEKPFKLLLKRKDVREMKKIKLHNSTDDSVFNTPVPEIIHKQIPNYLANKAQETLQQTKANQEILNKSLESDDWQESLQNWRERRRQVLSSSVVENVSNDSDNGDSKELMKLKEKARQMKQLRDQIKDQNIYQSQDQLDSQGSVSIPDIDDETKAMIERVKQKKLAEVQKRQFSLSSPTATAFASDSELSTSAGMDKADEDTLSLSEKNESDPIKPIEPIQWSNDISKTITSYNNNFDKPIQSEDNVKTRIIQVKLNQRSKEDSDQLWGMELIDRSGTILVSKVKIGSSADVCDIRKNDEIISINSKDVTNQSIEYVKSMFRKCASVISASEYLILSLKRSMSDDEFELEDDEFLSDNVSEIIEEKLMKEAVSCDNEESHLKDTNVKSINANIEFIENFNDVFSEDEMITNPTIEKSNYYLKNVYSNSTQSEIIAKTTNLNEKSFENSIENLSEIHSELPVISTKLPTDLENQNQNEYRLSVQDKIAKFECQNVSNTNALNTSWNIPKNVNSESSSYHTKYNQRSGGDCLSWNPDSSNSKIMDVNPPTLLPKFDDKKIENGNVKPTNYQKPLPWKSYDNKMDNSKEFTTITTQSNDNDNQKKMVTCASLSIESNVTPVDEDNEKSIEIEVSVTPQLFPMRNKSLFSRIPDDKHLNLKSIDSLTMERSFDDDENTLKSDYLKMTKFDEPVSPIKETTNTSFGIDNLLKEEINNLAIVKIRHSQYQEQPEDQHKLEDYDIIESNIDIEPTISTVPAPTLFKSSQNQDNSTSLKMLQPRSENINTIKKDSNSSSRKSKKSSKSHETTKRSVSHKEGRNIDIGSSNSYENTNRSSSINRKHSPSQVTFSNFIEDITQTKVHSKSYSIEKSVKTLPMPSEREKKKQKSHNKKMCSAEVSTKCNSCSKPAGSEDLMVIEELNLHFHLRCFICSECNVQLGDGKSDTDVRIRRSKLHCASCYAKKASKSKHKNPFSLRHSQSKANNNQTKGGHGDGNSIIINSGDSNNNGAFSTASLSTAPTRFIDRISSAFNPPFQFHKS